MVLEVYGTRSTSLIICLASLVYNWEYEIHTFAPALTVLTLTGSGSEREEALHHVKDDLLKILS